MCGYWDGCGTGTPCGNMSSVPHPSQMSFEVEVLVGTEGRMICELLRTYIRVLIGVTRATRAYVSSYPGNTRPPVPRTGYAAKTCGTDSRPPSVPVRPRRSDQGKVWDGWVSGIVIA
jgi:hypothetical protein